LGFADYGDDSLSSTFPSDIIAGWMVAIAWAIGVSLIIKPDSQSANIISEQPVSETKLLSEEQEFFNS